MKDLDNIILDEIAESVLDSESKNIGGLDNAAKMRDIVKLYDALHEKYSYEYEEKGRLLTKNLRYWLTFSPKIKDVLLFINKYNKENPSRYNPLEVRLSYREKDYMCIRVSRDTTGMGALVVDKVADMIDDIIKREYPNANVEKVVEGTPGHSFSFGRRVEANYFTYFIFKDIPKTPGKW